MDRRERDDTALARAAALGDPDAFEEIVLRHGPALYRYARRLTRDDGEAQDAVQEALLGAWKGIDRFEGRSGLRTWLFSLTARKVADRYRRARADPVDDALLTTRPAGSDSDPFEQASGSELRQALDRALAELPYRQRACWLLVEVEQLTQAEVAQVLGISPDAVRGQLFRARRTLEERMARWR